MRRFIAGRLVSMVFVVWAITTLMFVLLRLLPGDPVSWFLDAGLPQEAVARQRAAWGLDAPLGVQYVRYLANLLTFDFGVSFIHLTPVRPILLEKVINTLALMVPSILAIAAASTVIGAYLGWRRGSRMEQGVILTLLVVRSFPAFFLGIVLLMLFAYNWQVLPSGGMGPSARGEGTIGLVFASTFPRYLLLPAATVVLRWMADPTLLMRTSIIEVKGAEFLTLLRAKGLSEWRLVRHAARNAILPVVTYLMVMIGLMFEGQVLVELLFSWPGIGREIVTAINARDYPVAQAAFFVIALTVVVMNFLADILYGYLDPRVSVHAERV
jgi:peptide/nickel transport system permease protein